MLTSDADTCERSNGLIDSTLIGIFGELFVGSSRYNE